MTTVYVGLGAVFLGLLGLFVYAATQVLEIQIFLLFMAVGVVISLVISLTKWAARYIEEVRMAEKKRGRSK
jgi:5-bromo-4-chloroindolyl phosphate hydrolysis protein